MRHRGRQTVVCALLAASLALGGSSAAAASSGGAGTSAEPVASGGAALAGPAPDRTSIRQIPAPPGRNSKGSWLKGVTITEYWPAPESWFVGQMVSAPGLTGKHRIDWLYSAEGVSMQGEGFGLDGRMYHIASIGSEGWVTVAGRPTSPSDGWAGGSPYWRAGAFWRNLAGAVTFPLLAGGWSAGRGHSYVALPGVTFAPGASLPLRFYGSIAVDPAVIPLGSLVYVPAYRRDGQGGWFLAQDTGGAIRGHHIDVYRTPPSTPGAAGQYLTGQRIYVIKPQAHAASRVASSH